MAILVMAVQPFPPNYIWEQLAEDCLAGSALKMHNGVSNLIRLAGLNPGAITLATINPGDRADLITFFVRDNFQLEIVSHHLAK